MWLVIEPTSLQKLSKAAPGANSINVLQADFTLADPKRTK